MRIAVHDYAGFAFTEELSRELASRGHDVLYLYCSDVVGARGVAAVRADDPPGFVIQAATIGRTFEKYSLVRRFRDEEAYGRAAAARIRAFDPRVVLSADTPLLSQARLLAEARRHGRRFVYWWQDSYGIGLRQVVRRRRPALAPMAATPFEALERRMLGASDHVVAISEGLRRHALQWGVDPGHMSVISNWAPVREITPGPSENPWKEGNGLAGRSLVIYSGTLGLKHNPELLVALAAELNGTETRVVVASQGPGRQLLEKRRCQLELKNLVLLDYQPHDQFGEMLAAGDVLIAMIEADAAAFSVPSKICSYLCAGRAIVASIPPENQAAEVIRSADAGICVSPDAPDAFVRAVVDVLGDAELRRRLAQNGRAYAVSHFDIGGIADRFEQILRGPRGASRRFGPIGVAAATVGRIWSHPQNRCRRWRAVATYAAWQGWERTVRRPWTVPLTSTRRIRCYPHCPVTSSVLYYRLADDAEMRFLLDVLADGEVFLDIGAHAGVYSVLASSVPGVRVVAVEPSSATFARLVENVSLNHIGERVTPLQLAVSNRRGEARLSIGLDAMNALVHGDDDDSEPVALTTVDSLMADLDIPTVGLVKIDVEGGELDVLTGAQDTIEASRPPIIVEVNDPEGLASFAARAGYTSVRYGEDRSLVPTSIGSCHGRNALLVGDLDEARRRLQR